jgi:GNAT superfamily N-acetyltransferase
MVGLLQELFSIEKDFVCNVRRQRCGLQQMLGRSRLRRVWVAVQADSAVGMCTAQVVVSTALGGPAAVVEDVVVRSDARGQGIGRQLMEAVAAWARHRGLTRLQLLADKTNLPALGFYRALGWKETRMICLQNHTTTPDTLL